MESNELENEILTLKCTVQDCKSYIAKLESRLKLSETAITQLQDTIDQYCIKAKPSLQITITKIDTLLKLIDTANNNSSHEYFSIDTSYVETIKNKILNDNIDKRDFNILNTLYKKYQK